MEHVTEKSSRQTPLVSKTYCGGNWMQIYDVIIIGTGPAGLFTGICCGGEDRKVLILEKNLSAGKKLLLSGAGQCNITHEGEIRDFFNFYGENGRFLKHALFNFTNSDLLDFFRKRGLDFISTDNGKIFPATLKASDVLDILIQECEKNKVQIKYNEAVMEVRYNESEEIFQIKTKNRKYKSKKIVIATGGKSYSTTGSTGDGYVFARSLGHTIEKPLPALTPIYIKNYPFKELSGISFENVPISLWRENKKMRTTFGDVLFTHKNISGPGILNFSRYVMPGDTIKINFVGIEDIEGFRRDFIEDIQSNGKLLVKTILREYTLPKRFIDKLLAIVGIGEETTGAHLNKKKRNKLIEMLTGFPMIVEKLGGFHLAMVTKGGVSLKEVSSKTMESNIVKGLYFVGEVLDIDGDTGGYNIQAAFSTGYVAARNIRGNLSAQKM